MRHRWQNAILSALLLLVAPSRSSADQKWTRIDTSNFVLVGTVSESRLRMIGTQFEGFREALTRLLANGSTTTAVPTAVVVFSDEKSLQPFKPVYQGKAVEISGLFIPGANINYILLGPQRFTDDLRSVFHEYSHLIVSNVAPDLPVWVNEGLAEYYSSFEIGNDGHSVTIGRPIDSHYLELSREPWLSIKDLTGTLHDSPQYNENSRRGVFYAESWMLVHMLLHGDKPDRRPQFGAYLRELSNGTAPDAAWEKQFGQDDILKALRAYSGRGLIGARRYTMSDRIARTPGTVVPLAAGEIESMLGEVLLAEDHREEAVKRFDQSLALQPASLRASVGKSSAAQTPLQLAPDVALPADWLSNYMIGASILRHSGSSDTAAQATARAALARAVADRGDIPSVQVLFAEANDDDADVGAAVAALTKAHMAVPVRDDYALLLARALARKRDFTAARSVLGTVIARPHLAGIRDAAFAMMRQIVASEQHGPQRTADTYTPASDQPSSTSGNNGAPTDSKLQYVFRDLKPGERRVEGTLERIVCSAGSVEFIVRTPDRLARFQVARMESVEFITYRTDLQGNVTCGARTPPDPVYVTARDGQLDGTVVAIEFLPRR